MTARESIKILEDRMNEAIIDIILQKVSLPE